ncbi:MAG: hypothetical protein H6R26_2280 [Proteobacteria bacterium]|nr:hypothetical protein [Pseudomonadota bacterium]
MTFGFLVGLPLVLIGLAAMIGARLPKSHVAASRIRLSASPEEIWSTITDFAGHPTWRPGLHAVEAGPEVDGCPSWFEVCAANIRVQFALTESDPPRRLATRLVGERLPINSTWIYELRAADGGTIVTITENDAIYSPLFRFFTRFILSYYGTMDIFLIALAQKFDEQTEPEHLILKQEKPA